MRRSFNIFDRDWRGGLHALTRSHARALAVLLLFAIAAFGPGLAKLQPMDRDEPRFAQASKQMLETGDFVDIRFQDEARHKKPVGIYWLQTLSVAIGEAVGIEDARRQILLYRLPSFLGAIGMVLLTYWAALAFLSREGAFLAAMMLAVSVLLGVEARLAKTDAMLGLCAVAVLGFLARGYFMARAPGVAPRLATWHLGTFWAVMALAILIKGPIVPLIAVLLLLVIGLRDRDLSWIRAMRPGMGFLIVGIIVLPWLSLILTKTGGSFLQDSIGKDMLLKAVGAQERHGAPPGSYFGFFWLSFWPAAPLALLAAPFVWRERRDDGVALLLAWLVPFWLALEIVPTKLPHYVLPLYPAIAILIMLAIERGGLSKARAPSLIAALLLALPPFLMLIGVPVLFGLLEEGAFFTRIPFFAAPFLVLAALFGGIGAFLLARQRALRALSAGATAAILLAIGAYSFGLPMLKALNLSPRLAAAAQASGCPDPAFASVGYREPSLVFLTRSDIQMSDPEAAAAFLDAKGDGCRIAFIERAFEARFRAALGGESAPALITRIRGVNLNAAIDKAGKLRVLDIAVYVRR